MHLLTKQAATISNWQPRRQRSRTMDDRRRRRRTCTWTRSSSSYFLWRTHNRTSFDIFILCPLSQSPVLFQTSFCFRFFFCSATRQICTLPFAQTSIHQTCVTAATTSTCRMRRILVLFMWTASIFGHQRTAHAKESETHRKEKKCRQIYYFVIILGKQTLPPLPTCGESLFYWHFGYRSFSGIWIWSERNRNFCALCVIAVDDNWCVDGMLLADGHDSCHTIRHTPYIASQPIVYIYFCTANAQRTAHTMHTRVYFSHTKPQETKQTNFILISRNNLRCMDLECTQHE